jgi:hypothetical protein
MAVKVSGAGLSSHNGMIKRPFPAMSCQYPRPPYPHTRLSMPRLLKSPDATIAVQRLARSTPYP